MRRTAVRTVTRCGPTTARERRPTTTGTCAAATTPTAPIDDLAWTMDLDAATLWLDGLPHRGRDRRAGRGHRLVVAAAGRRRASCGATTRCPRRSTWRVDRLLAHGLRAHLHERDAWAEPDRPVDALFCGFWLSHVPRARLADFLALCASLAEARWHLRLHRLTALIPPPARPATPGIPRPRPRRAASTMRPSGSRRSTTKPDALEQALVAAGFGEAEVRATSRFFLLGRGRMPASKLGG